MSKPPSPDILPLADNHSDLNLITSLNEGSEKAFDELFKKYWHKAYQIACAKTKSREISKEIVQDIFMGLWDKRGNLTITNFPQYLNAAIKYRSIDFIRSKLVQQKYWDYYRAYIPQTDNSTEKKVAFNELMDNIEVRLETMPAKSRQVFYLHKLEGKSIKEISCLLKLSEKAIEYHLTKSLKALKPHLKDFIFLAAIFSV